MYCYCKGQRGCGDLKVVYILNVCQIGGEGECHQIFLFPKFKKVHIFVGEGEAGGGVKKIMDFSHFLPLMGGAHKTQKNRDGSEKTHKMSQFRG